MSENEERIETLETLGGNTRKPPKSPQCTQKMHWFFTWNNYKEEDIETLERLFQHLAFKYCFQKEKGKEGTPHLQGVVSLKKAMRWTEFGLPKTIHWEKVGNLTDAFLYCCKSESREEGTKPYCLNYSPPREIKLITPNKWWQQEILEIFKTEADDRIINWYWSRKGGVGKSSFTKYCVIKENCLFFEEGKKADIMHLIYNAPEDKLEKMIIDVPKANGNNISYKSLECLKNGLIYSSKYEGGYKWFPNPHIVVFANEEPDYSQMTEEGRWNVRNIDE